MKRWYEVGDVNQLAYGAKWFRHVGERRFHVVELTNMDEACGRDNKGRPRYVVELSEVDLDGANLKAAMDCVGLREEDLPKESERRGYSKDMALAEAVHSYGERAPLDSYEGNNGWKGVREIKRESLSLEADPDAYEERMNRPVNQLGSTAREFQRGDFTSAMQRGVEAGDPKARLMAKMHGAPQDVIDDTRPDDYLPYVFGYMTALDGREKDAESADYAPEYHRGFERGERVRKGECPAPSWITKAGPVSTVGV
jgi:hypothetical protein